MFWTVTQSLLTGLATTFEIFILTLIFALPLGLVLAFGLLSKFKPLQRLVQILVWIIRGTPLMLQLIHYFLWTGALAPYDRLERKRERTDHRNRSGICD